MGLTEVKLRRAHEVADVFDEKDGVVLRRQRLHGKRHLFGIEVTAFAGINLHGAGSRFTDAACVVVGLQIPFDDVHHGVTFFACTDSGGQKFSFS